MNPNYLQLIFILLLSGISGAGARAAQAAPDMEGAPDSTLVITFYNRFDKFIPDSTYLSNPGSYATMASFLGDTCVINSLDSIIISSKASPEGSFPYNVKLALRRANYMRKYIMTNHPEIPADKIRVSSEVCSWSDLRQAVHTHPDAPFTRQIITLIENHKGRAAIERSLRGSDKGQTWRYMEQSYMPPLRTSTVAITTHCPALFPAPEPEVIVEQEVVEVVEEAPVNYTPRLTPVEWVHPYVALKTNLLFDVATALNVELEVPIGHRFSIAGEWIFPWWLSKSRQRALEIQNGNLEFRYWWGNRARRPVLDGWFSGIYSGVGYYDVEWNKKGYQGEFFIAGGISTGYTHRLGRRLAMEYSLGLGVLRTKYRHYHAFQHEDGQWHLVRQSSGHQTWVGPTRAKVSLLWFPKFLSR